VNWAVLSGKQLSRPATSSRHTLRSALSSSFTHSYALHAFRDDASFVQTVDSLFATRFATIVNDSSLPMGGDWRPATTQLAPSISPSRATITRAIASTITGATYAISSLLATVERHGIVVDHIARTWLSHQITNSWLHGSQGASAQSRQAFGNAIRTAVKQQPDVLPQLHELLLPFALGMTDIVPTPPTLSGATPVVSTVSTALASTTSVTKSAASSLPIDLHPLTPAIAHSSTHTPSSLLWRALLHWLSRSSPLDWSLCLTWLAHLHALSEAVSTLPMAGNGLTLAPAATSSSSTSSSMDTSTAVRTDLRLLATPPSLTLQSVSDPVCPPTLSSQLEWTSRAMSRVYTHPLVMAYIAQRRRLASIIGVHASWMDRQSLDLYDNPTSMDLLHLLAVQHGETVVQEYHQMIALLIWSNFTIRTMPRQLVEQSQLDDVKSKRSLNPSSLTPLQQSMAAHARLLDHARIAHPFLQYIYPLFIALDALVHAIFVTVSNTPSIHSANNDSMVISLGQLLQCRSHLWDTLCTNSGGSTFDTQLESVHVRWRALVKAYGELASVLKSCAMASVDTVGQAMTHCQNLFDKSTTSLHEGIYQGVKDILWRRGGHPVLPRTSMLQRIEDQLISLNTALKFDVTPSTPLSELQRHILFMVDGDWKRQLVEAMCNLRFVQQDSIAIMSNSSNASSLLTSLVEVPANLEKRLEKLREIQKGGHSADRGSFLVQLHSHADGSLDDMKISKQALGNSFDPNFAFQYQPFLIIVLRG
jgi:hypothetical protein